MSSDMTVLRAFLDMAKTSNLSADHGRYISGLVMKSKRNIWDRFCGRIRHPTSGRAICVPAWSLTNGFI